MIDNPDVMAIVGIICPTGRCEDCQRKARDVLTTFAARLIPRGAAIQKFTDHRWLNTKTGADQTALSAREDPANWTQVQRQAGRWYGEWEQL